eukprot:m.270006 g.270006  ORF g.270006 m.270006 type:complete len:121 (-) comp16261_c0_seq5:289-651(-)
MLLSSFTANTMAFGDSCWLSMHLNRVTHASVQLHLRQYGSEFQMNEIIIFIEEYMSDRVIFDSCDVLTFIDNEQLAQGTSLTLEQADDFLQSYRRAAMHLVNQCKSNSPKRPPAYFFHVF